MRAFTFLLPFASILITLSSGSDPESHQYQWHEQEENADESQPAHNDIILGGAHGAGGYWPTTTLGPTTANPCKVDSLIQCLFEPLDEWAMVLYTLKENIVAISGKHCNTTRDMIRRCVEEHAPGRYDCDQRSVLKVAATMTDLLMHKKNSGNLLRSYYVTAYVCTREGQLLRSRISDACLLQEHVGELTFQAMKYVDDYLSVNRTATLHERCSFLRHRSLLMRAIGNHKCASHEPIDAGFLMCETLKLAVQKMHPGTFGSGHCDFTCRDDQSDHPLTIVGSEESDQRITDQEQMSGSAGPRAKVKLIIKFVTALFPLAISSGVWS